MVRAVVDIPLAGAAFKTWRGQEERTGQLSHGRSGPLSPWGMAGGAAAGATSHVVRSRQLVGPGLAHYTLPTGAVASSSLCSVTPDRAGFPDYRDGHGSVYKPGGQKVHPETEGSPFTEDGMPESLAAENSLLLVLGAQSVQAGGALSKPEEA